MATGNVENVETSCNLQRCNWNCWLRGSCRRRVSNFYLFYQRPWRRDKLCKRGFRIRLDCLLYCSMYGAMQFYLRRGNTFAKFCFPTNFHLSASSISSKDLPLVSGMSTAHTNAVRNVHPANRKYASKLLVDNKIGVVNATRKLVDQLLPCARLVADARVRCGWISAA